MKMTFSEMLQHATNFELQIGEVGGTCCLCGNHTETGNPISFKQNFTSADYISTGDCICEYCQYLIDNSDNLRRSMYILTNNEFKKFKKKDIPNILFNLPNEPFYVYLTETYQKVGWVRMNQVYNPGDAEVVQVLLDYDIIEFTVPDLRKKYDVVNKLRELKITKDNIKRGDFEMYQYQRIIDAYGIDEARQLHEYCQKNKTNPVWDLACYIGK